MSPNKIRRPPSCCTQLLPFCRRGSRWTPTGTIANTEDAMPSPDARVWLRGIANCAHSPGPSLGCLATATLGYLFTHECPAVEESPQILTRATRTHSSFGNHFRTTRKPLRPAPQIGLVPGCFPDGSRDRLLVALGSFRDASRISSRLPRGLRIASWYTMAQWDS